MEYEPLAGEYRVKLRPGPGFLVFCTVLINVLLSIFLFTVTMRASLPSVSIALSSMEETTMEELALTDSGDVSGQTLPNQPSAQEDAVTNLSCAVNGHFPPAILQWCELITRYANKRGLPPDLVAALILQESGGNPLAYSRSGAVGLMQVMPRDGLAASFACVNGPCFSDRPSIPELQNPEFNIAYGTKMLANLLKRYGNLREALKSYGPMKVGYYYADKVLGLFQRYGEHSP